MAGLYVHIPFCRSRCVYCDFFSTKLEHRQSEYIDALCREMQLRKDYLSEPVATVYIGGGTPSLLSDDSLRRLIDAVYHFVGNDKQIEEITIELNPDDVTAHKAQLLHSLGINRVSMGIQTFDDSRLRFLRRRHTSQQAIEAYSTLKDAGFDNISIDLMFGFPGETIDDWIADVEKVIGMSPQHISAYSLMIEENTPLYNIMCSGELKEIDDDMSRAMYEKLCSLLAEAGYEHYEISNFAMPNFRSRHNANYWKAVEYIGIGAAAHSYNHTTRSWNIDNIDTYIEKINNDNLPQEVEYLNETMRYNDLITTAMRTKEGVDLNYIAANFDKKYVNHIAKESKSLIERQLVTIENNRLRLTHNGLFVSDNIMSDLIFI